MQLLEVQCIDGNTQELSSGSAGGKEFEVYYRKCQIRLRKFLGFFMLENCLEIHGANKESWGKLLPAQLSSKATNVYSHLTITECKQYDIVKRAILASFRLTAKVYLERFRSVARSGTETYRLFHNRLKELKDYYLDLIFRGRLDIQWVFGRTGSIPVAEVVIHSPRFGNDHEFTEEVGIVDDLPFECVIGNQFVKSRSDVKDVIDCGWISHHCVRRQHVVKTAAERKLWA